MLRKKMFVLRQRSPATFSSSLQSIKVVALSSLKNKRLSSHNSQIDSGVIVTLPWRSWSSPISSRVIPPSHGSFEITFESSFTKSFADCEIFILERTRLLLKPFNLELSFLKYLFLCVDLTLKWYVYIRIKCLRKKTLHLHFYCAGIGLTPHRHFLRSFNVDKEKQ